MGPLFLSGIKMATHKPSGKKNISEECLSRSTDTSSSRHGDFYPAGIILRSYPRSSILRPYVFLPQANRNPRVIKDFRGWFQNHIVAAGDKDTRPELVVRKLVYHLGFRYRLHDPLLPGKPDLEFRETRKVIFVHGCFWHRHLCGNGRANPKTNSEFWRKKLGGNVSRDRKNRRALLKDGWKVLVIWECQTVENRHEWLREKLVRFLGDPPSRWYIPTTG